MMTRIKTPKLPLVGRRNTVVIWILLRLLTSHISGPGVSAQDVRIILRLESMMEQNRDR